MDAYLNGLNVSEMVYRRAPNGQTLPAPGGMFGLGMGTPVVRGGVEPSGDLGEGTDLPNILAGQASAGRGDSYTPLPGVLPSKDHLDYVQKFSTAGLLAVGFVLLILVGVFNPGRAVGLLASGAKRQAGIA